MTEEPDLDSGTPFVRWPDPSPLQSWWADIMAGGPPNRPTRAVSRARPRLRPA